MPLGYFKEFFGLPAWSAALSWRTDSTRQPAQLPTTQEGLSALLWLWRVCPQVPKEVSLCGQAKQDGTPRGVARAVDKTPELREKLP